jgi:ATP-binding cassette, subfamily B, bacterial MsbA
MSVPPGSVPTSDLALYRRLFAWVRPHWLTFAGGLLAMVVYALTESALPALLKMLLDGSFVGQDRSRVHLAPLAIVGLFLVRGLSDFLHLTAMHKVASQVVLSLRRAMFDRMLALPASYYDRETSAELMTRLTFTADHVRPLITTAFITLVKDSLIVLGLIGYMLYLDWQLALVFFIVVPVIAWIIQSVSRRMRQLSQSQQTSMGAMTHVIDEAIGAHREIKVFGGAAYESQRFADGAGTVERYLMKVIRTSAANGPVVQAIAVVALAAIVYYAALSAQLTVGAFVSFISAMALLLAPLKRLSNLNEVLQRGLAAATTCFAMLDEQPETDTGTRRIGRARGRIEFDKVQVRYPNAERDALKGVSLVIAEGESVALVGASGSGKTTLVSLISRFYPLNSGRLLLDGVDVGELALADLRANLALVTQHVVLFNDSVRNNIAYGRRADASEAQIVAAAEAAHAMEFIRRLPQGLDTPVGENGARLSGGQRQRLSIARALLKDAPILLLDEATSALDTESERLVQEALDNLKRGRTTLTIAHRLSTVAGADRVVVLDEGRIAEIGSPAELLARGGIYARLHRMQSGAAGGGSDVPALLA